MTRAHARAWFHAAVLAIGGIALWFLLHQMGWAATKAQVRKIGGWFIVIAVIDVVAVMADAFGVHGFLRAKTKVGFWGVFGAQASGLAINRLTPGNSLGEPVKVTMLTRYVPANHAISAIVMFNLVTAYVGIAMIVIGVPVTALMLDLPRRIELIVWIGMAVLIVGAVVIAVIVRRGAVATLVDTVGSLGVISKERAARWRVKVAEIDARLRELGNAKSSGLPRGLTGVLASRVLNSAGTIALLYAADIPLTPLLVIAMLSVGILVTWVSNVIPLGLGIADGTNYMLYSLLGASPDAGLVFTMVNRLRTVVLAIAGLMVMACVHLVQRRQAAVVVPAPLPVAELRPVPAEVRTDAADA